MTEIKVNKLFPVPVFEKKLDNYEQLNKELEKYIYDLQKDDPKGQVKSNSGGWHSPFFNMKNSPILQKFISNFSDYLFKVISDSMSWNCLLYTSPSPRDATLSRMPSSA